VNLLRDVHVLATQYHWTESDILRLTLSRRAAYLGLIEEQRDAALVAAIGRSN
jgi:hypothetical protein